MFDSFPRLIAAFHALHRLLAPRHPPHALMYLATVIHNHNQNNRNRNPSDTKSNKAACRQSFRTDCHTLRSENVYRCHLKFFELPKICSACRLVAHKMSRALFGERGSVSRLILSVNCLKSSFYKIQPVTSPHWRRSGSNRQPLPCKGSALPIELRPRLPCRVSA